MFLNASITRLIISTTSLALASGCITTAIVRRRSGPPIVAKIDRSDVSAMYVTTPSDARYRIEHQDVVDIDHPGNVIAMLGLSLLVTGAATWAAINQVENPSGFVAIPALFALECLVVGFPMAIYGGATYAQSVGAASPRQFNATQTGNR